MILIKKEKGLLFQFFHFFMINLMDNYKALINNQFF